MPSTVATLQSRALLLRCRDFLLTTWLNSPISSLWCRNPWAAKRGIVIVFGTGGLTRNPTFGYSRERNGVSVMAPLLKQFRDPNWASSKWASFYHLNYNEFLEKAGTPHARCPNSPGDGYSEVTLILLQYPSFIPSPWTPQRLRHGCAEVELTCSGLIQRFLKWRHSSEGQMKYNAVPHHESMGEQSDYMWFVQFFLSKID